MGQKGGKRRKGEERGGRGSCAIWWFCSTRRKQGYFCQVCYKACLISIWAFKSSSTVRVYTYKVLVLRSEYVWTHFWAYTSIGHVLGAWHIYTYSARTITTLSGGFSGYAYVLGRVIFRYDVLTSTRLEGRPDYSYTFYEKKKSGFSLYSSVPFKDFPHCFNKIIVFR